MSTRIAQMGECKPSQIRPSKRANAHLGTARWRRRKLQTLGVPFDNALSMRDAVGELVSEAAWKFTSIVRSARFFTDGELVNVYKSQLLSYLEYSTAAIYHACDSMLASP